MSMMLSFRLLSLSLLIIASCANPEPSGKESVLIDSDNDGLVDSRDICPNHYGEPTNGGCPNNVVVNSGEPQSANSSSSGTYKDKPASMTNRKSYIEDCISPNITMIEIPAGTFMMGSEYSENEMPVHSVELSKFYMSETEITQAQWRAVMGNNPSMSEKDCDDCPVEQVNWIEVLYFLLALNKRCDGRNYRLPTEAEWEYAARGGENYKYAGSDSLDLVAWYHNNSSDMKGVHVNQRKHPVKGKRPNGYGLYDMSGNVDEWCNDYFSDYEAGKQTNPQGPSKGMNKVIRGGNYFYWNSTRCRVSDHAAENPITRSGTIGFRIVSTQ